MKFNHDLSYKELFSHPILVQELMESFVHSDFVKDMDFSTLEKVDKSFITRDSKRRESDLIYRVNFNGEEAYIYLLLEFQSKNDYWMSMRILRYIMEFYSDLTKNFRSSQQKLPAVFPIMLYNGDTKWRSPVEISDIIKSSGIDDKYIPHFSYYKIAENEFPTEELLKLKNGVAAIFYAENSDKSDFTDYFNTVKDLVKRENPQLIAAIERWLLTLFSREEDQDEIMKIFESIKESTPMIETVVKRIQSKIKEEGIEEGIVIGVDKGIEIGVDKGIEIGVDKGTLDVARNLRAMGLSIPDIVKATGLPYDVVEKL